MKYEFDIFVDKLCRNGCRMAKPSEWLSLCTQG